LVCGLERIEHEKVFRFSLVALFFLAGGAFAQDIPQSQVPTEVVNNFKKTFPDATDVEWEMDGDRYKVEFEIGLLKMDHDVWYDAAGQVLKHQEEISTSDLPKKVTAAIKRKFKGYRIEDAEKITEGNQVAYILEVKSRTEEWKLAGDSEGNILNKVAD